jgi:Dyp-type peroxidase family
MDAMNIDRELDLADIQGNILQDFVSGFPAARFFLLRIEDSGSIGAYKARQFVLEYRAKVTTALRWAPSGAFTQKIQTTKPDVAINIGFTFMGLYRLELPTRTLSRLPTEFVDGMKARAEILGDKVNVGTTGVAGQEVDAVAQWDPVWRRDEQAHIIIGLNSGIDGDGNPLPGLDRETKALQDLCAKYDLEILSGHDKNGALWQDACALLAPGPAPSAVGNKQQMVNNKATGCHPVPVEHFGFIDGISNPVFEGQFGSPWADFEMSVGNGKLLPAKKGQDPLDPERWAPLATGELLLGYPDEAQEIAPMAAPGEIMRNGTFMVFRKLHENVKSFHDYFDQAASVYAKANNVPVDDACRILKAKMAGRWEDGVPVAVAPTIAEWREFDKKHKGDLTDRAYTNFIYSDDKAGAKCPVASHMRRANTRDDLNNLSSVLNNRRRILRRGQPYGKTTMDDAGDHGIIFLIMCADLGRQWEFVQQQWINYGLDANAGNDTCPIVGNRGGGDSKFIVPVDPKSSETPFIAAGLPQFVETRGGDYFFLPSMTALRMIGMGVTDPT